MKTESERLQSRYERELRRENIKLRKEIKSLRRQLLLNDRAAEDKDFDEEFELVDIAAIKESNFCPKCKDSHVSLFMLMEKQYYNCQCCGSKGQIPA